MILWQKLCEIRSMELYQPEAFQGFSFSLKTEIPDLPSKIASTMAHFSFSKKRNWFLLVPILKVMNDMTPPLIETGDNTHIIGK